ncbi:hypothetical protein [Variovorax sp. J22R115]|uniref:hypothetical protein n=1 Tax=Variovorax sp. J22R115 TaxID=3053509 RepID=UPI0034DFF52D
MGFERRLALESAGELLQELAKGSLRPGPGEHPMDLPTLQERARHILRHYPEPWQIEAATRNPRPLREWISAGP